MSQPVGYELSVQQRELLGGGEAVGALRNQLVVDIGDVEPKDAAAALWRAVESHEIFRTTFQRPSGLRHPLQVVGSEVAVDIEVAADIEAEGAPPGSGPAWGQEAGLGRLLDASRGPVLQARVGRHGATAFLAMEALALVADVETLEALAAAAQQAVSPQALSGGLAGAPEPVPPLAYAEYAAWQAGLPADGSDEDAQAAAYLEALSRVPATKLALLPMPGSDGPAVHARVPVEAGPATLGRLKQLAEEAGGGLMDAWLALWTAVIARVTGEEKVVVGLDVDGRAGTDELSGAAGPYRRSVPVVVATDGADFVRLVRLLAAARDHAQRLVHRLPLMAETAESAESRPVLLFSVAPEQAQIGRLPFQLELRVAPSGQAAVLAGPLAGTGDANEAAGWLSVLASEVARSPQTQLAELDLVSPAQSEPLLALGRGPSTAWQAEGGDIAERVAARAIEAPGAEAVFDGQASLSYGDLLARADGLAAKLAALPGALAAPVGVYLPRAADAVVTLLGVLRAGAAYLPIAVDQPAARVAGILSDAGARAVVTTEALAGTLAEARFEGEVVIIEAAGRAPGPVLPENRAEAGELAYVLYTSGSTGAPKGVEVTRRGLANYVSSILSLLGPSQRSRRFAHVTSLATDLGNTCLFPALVTGGVLDLVPAEVVADPETFAAWGRERPVDVLKITPSHLAALLASDDPAVLPKEVLVVGGEASTWALMDRVAKLGGCRVVNHYGPTETTVGCLAYDLSEAARHRGRPTVPIGRPLPNTEAVVLGPDLELAPRGAAGELCIGGAGLARGYVADPARTAERFVAHPYRPGERLYRTGDRARVLPDGVFEFLGREDGQVKVRGFRVECGEIEEALRRHHQVQRAAVVLREDEPGQPRLVAYFVSHFHPSPDQAELRRHLSELVPDYMVPAAFVELDALPLTPSGKLDRASLPVPEMVASAAYEAPRTPVEKQLAEIFSDLLGVENVGAYDDFFELGGHSLLATQAVVRARSTFGINLPVHALFLHPSVASLAEEVERERAEAGVAEALAGEDVEAMMAAIAAMSDEEAAALLAAQSEEGEP